MRSRENCMIFCRRLASSNIAPLSVLYSCTAFEGLQGPVDHSISSPAVHNLAHIWPAQLFVLLLMVVEDFRAHGCCWGRVIVCL